MLRAHSFFVGALALSLSIPTRGSGAVSPNASADGGAFFDVYVHGKPEVVQEHIELALPGKYIKTVFLRLTQQQKIVAVPVHDGEPLSMQFNFYRSPCNAELENRLIEMCRYMQWP